MRLGLGEILVIIVVLLLVFGPNKLPQLGDALGKGIRNFKKATTQAHDAEESEEPKLTSGSSEVSQNGVRSDAKKV
ncbi:MAG TPA: twin-arginine translocase TatA/TatE family subunit [Anaeromyxobacteraceae bacterium]|nr:twin-arginine translocase TatA/TatE family subunit [Anaeromyxobacteraceae bacterium]